MKEKIAYVSPSAFLACFDRGDEDEGDGQACRRKIRRVTLHGVPEDARVDRVWYDPALKFFGLGIVHDSFDEVPEGEAPPKVKVTFTLMGREVLVDPVGYGVKEVQWPVVHRVYKPERK